VNIGLFRFENNQTNECVAYRDDNRFGAFQVAARACGVCAAALGGALIVFMVMEWFFNICCSKCMQLWMFTCAQVSSTVYEFDLTSILRALSFVSRFRPLHLLIQFSNWYLFLISFHCKQGCQACTFLLCKINLYMFSMYIWDLSITEWSSLYVRFFQCMVSSFIVLIRLP